MVPGAEAIFKMDVIHDSAEKVKPWLHMKVVSIVAEAQCLPQLPFG